MNDVLRLLTDEELLERTAELVTRGRRVDAMLIAHLAEVEERRLHLREAYPSMFAYATGRLRLSESQAYERIAVARKSREVPAMLEMLGDGRLTLTAAARIAPHLTRDNAASVLARVAHASKREVQLVVAELSPQPDVKPSVRLVRPAAAAPAPAPTPAPTPTPTPTPAPTKGGVRPAGVAQLQQVLMPIAPARFKVQFTASEELEVKIRRAQALMRYRVPDGDLAEIVERAVDLLLEDLERTRCSKAKRPRKSVDESDATARSRYVPAAVRRAVWERDGGRCTFEQAGQRCECREGLELDHVVPFARGGDHSVDNLRLMCRSHNGFVAEGELGRSFMAEMRGS